MNKHYELRFVFVLQDRAFHRCVILISKTRSEIICLKASLTSELAQKLLLILHIAFLG